MRMDPRTLAVVALILVASLGLVWFLTERPAAPVEGVPMAEPIPQTPAATPDAARRITARLFYVSRDGLRLTAVEREVPYGETAAEQATRIIEAQLEPAPSPYGPAIPAGTRLRTVFVTAGGEAYVDLSGEVASAHPGGSLNELLTVHAIVNALTVNLPAITAVQILLDGREVDTLAGHVDLRRPLTPSPAWAARTQTASLSQ